MPLASILAAFPLLTLPVAGVALADIPGTTRDLLLDAYLCVFGFTHFWVTFAIYLSRGNLDHFGESPRNRWIYFYVPISIFLFFGLFFGTGLASTFPSAALAVLVAVRFVNYRHLTRQVYGVSRLLWRSYGLTGGGGLEKAEQGLLSVLTMAMFLTHLHGGRFTPEPLDVKLVLGLASVFGAWVVGEYARAFLRSESPAALLVPAGYMVLQVLSVSLAVFRTDLYIATLAMHYVEYHVLMAPRCFGVPLDRTTQPDRFFASLRRNRAAFYGALLALSVAFLFAQKTSVALSAQGSLRPHLFDSLFVFHFFVECFIWKMGVPHYRRSLGPLYFPVRA